MKYLRKPNVAPRGIPVTNGGPTPTPAIVHHAPANVALVAPVGPLFEDSLSYPHPTFALAVSHCPWRPDRVAIMEKMRPIMVIPGMPYREITERAHNSVWSRSMWGWGASQGVTHTVYVQDDLRLHPKFWPVIEAMVRAVPNRILSLISNHPLSERALSQGHVWFRMCETLGAGYIVPTALMGSFLDWRDRRPPEEIYALCEDYVLSRWQYETGRRSWCPIPTLVQTIEDVATTNPAIDYCFRRSYCTWEDPLVYGKPLTSIDYWQPRGVPPDFGPTVGNDLRMARGPFQNDEILDAHYRIERSEGKKGRP